MNKENILGYVLIIFIVLICVKMYLETDMFHLQCIVSSVDGNKYCVRERKNMNKAVNLLAKTTEKMNTLVEHLSNSYPDNDVCNMLKKNFNPKKIKEILPTSEYTAYSENKGEKIAFCLNKNGKENVDNLIDENTLMFVALHEMSHLCTKSIGHTDEFWSNFKFILVEAEKIGIYKPIDYKNKETNYCGMPINDNPYFDYE